MDGKNKRRNITKEDVGVMLDNIMESKRIVSYANEQTADETQDMESGMTEAQAYMSNLIGAYMTKCNEKKPKKAEELVYIM